MLRSILGMTGTIKLGTNPVITDVHYKSNDIYCPEILDRIREYGSRVLDSEYHYKEEWVKDEGGDRIETSIGLSLVFSYSQDLNLWLKHRLYFDYDRRNKSDYCFKAIKYGIYTLYNCIPLGYTIDKDYIKLTLSLSAEYVIKDV